MDNVEDKCKSHFRKQCRGGENETIWRTNVNQLQIAAGGGGENRSHMAEVQRRRTEWLMWRGHANPILGSNAEEVKIKI